MLVKKDFKKLCKQLNEYGFKNYQEFLNSGLWKEFRATLYKRDRPARCAICSNKTTFLSLHHKAYKRILDPKNVIWVCESCHKNIHSKVEKSIQFETDKLFVELGCHNHKRRVGSLEVILSSGLPATLHHSIHSSGVVRKVKNGESADSCLEGYYKRKLRKKDEFMISLLEQNKGKIIRYLGTFTTN